MSLARIETPVVAIRVFAYIAVRVPAYFSVLWRWQRYRQAPKRSDVSYPLITICDATDP